MSKRRYYSLQSFFTYIRGFRWKFLLVIFWFVIANAALAIIPVFIGKLTGVLATQPIDTDQAYLYAWILVACSIGHHITWHLSELLYLKYLQPLSFMYETMVFREVIQKPYHFFVDKFTGKISAYIGTLGEELRHFVDNILYNYTNQVVRLVTISFVLLTVNVWTGGIFVAGLLLMLILGRHTIKNSVKYERHSTDVQSTKTGNIVDSITNFVNVKSFRKEQAEIADIEKAQAATYQAARKSSLWNMFFWGSMGVVVRMIIWPLSILLNVHLLLTQEITVAEFTTFMTSVLLFSDFVWGTIWNVSQFNLKLARVEEAHRHLFGKVNILAKGTGRRNVAVQTPGFQTSLHLKNLSFAYPDRPDIEVLPGISLRIKKGEKIGVVGRSGSGKSTLAKLLLGYYPIEVEQLFVDDRPVSTAELSGLIGFVPQDTALFHRSIADNIAYATDQPVSRDEIVEAAKLAHANEFIGDINKGYDALVGERGVKLSTGQRQRIAIARAFLDNKPILILDEATSALDSESELLVQEALEKLWEDKTVIAIAHRLSTLRHMDRIIVMGKSGVVEQGTHEALLKRGGTYAKLWAHQSGGFLED